MLVCGDGKFYKPICGMVGDCFGAEVPGGADVGNCPADAYQPKD